MAIVLGLVAFGGAAGFVVRRSVTLWVLGVATAAVTVSVIAVGSDGDQDTAATSALLTALFVWLPLAAGYAVGTALGRQRRRRHASVSTASADRFGA